MFCLLLRKYVEVDAFKREPTGSMYQEDRGLVLEPDSYRGVALKLDSYRGVLLESDSYI